MTPQEKEHLLIGVVVVLCLLLAYCSFRKGETFIARWNGCTRSNQCDQSKGEACRKSGPGGTGRCITQADCQWVASHDKTSPAEGCRPVDSIGNLLGFGGPVAPLGPVIHPVVNMDPRARMSEGQRIQYNMGLQRQQEQHDFNHFLGL